MSCRGAAYVLYWETYCNECNGKIPVCGHPDFYDKTVYNYGGRCNDPGQAVTEEKALNGFCESSDLVVSFTP